MFMLEFMGKHWSGCLYLGLQINCDQDSYIGEHWSGLCISLYANIDHVFILESIGKIAKFILESTYNYRLQVYA